MASTSTIFNEMVTVNFRNHKRKVTDNIGKHNYLYRRMKEGGKIRKESGGNEIALPLAYAENSTYQRYSGYDALSTNASDVLTSAKFDWMQAAIHVTASGRELRQSSGEANLIKLVKARMKVAQTTAANKMSIDVYSDGALTNQIGGLASMITTAGTGTVGGLNSTTDTWWQNQIQEVAGGDVAADGAFTGTALTFANLRLAMNTIYKACTIGADEPDMLIFTHDMHTLFESGLQDLQRYMSADAGKLGFNAYRYKKSDVVFDSNTNFGTTAEIGYVLNTDYLWLYEHEDAAWDSDGERVPTNQDAVVVPMYWMGNMATDNRRMLGKIFDVAT